AGLTGANAAMDAAMTMKMGPGGATFWNLLNKAAPTATTEIRGIAAPGATWLAKPSAKLTIIAKAEAMMTGMRWFRRVPGRYRNDKPATAPKAPSVGRPK